jgi:hypothetical protein
MGVPGGPSSEMPAGVPRRRYAWVLFIVVPVVIGIPVLASVIAAQAQVEIGRRFLEAVRTGDAQTAEALSAGNVQNGVRDCLAAGASCAHALGPVIDAIRGATSVEASTNVGVSWNERCVEGTAWSSGRDVSVYLILRKLDQGWLVTDLSTRRQLGTACDDT